MSTIININLRDKIIVLRTKTLEETLTNILLLIEKLETKKLEPKLNEVENNLVKIKKKDNMDENLYFLAILTQIPGCSMNTAKKIQEQANSILKLYELYNNKNTDIIKNIIIGKKKIGEKLTNRIFQYLFIL